MEHPRGAVHLGEPLVRAVCREAEEETGLQVKTLRPVEVFERILPDEAGRILYHYVLIDYLCQVLGGSLRAGSDALEADWDSSERSGPIGIDSRDRSGYYKAFNLEKEIFS